MRSHEQTCPFKSHQNSHNITTRTLIPQNSVPLTTTKPFGDRKSSHPMTENPKSSLILQKIPRILAQNSVEEGDEYEKELEQNEVKIDSLLHDLERNKQKILKRCMPLLDLKGLCASRSEVFDQNKNKENCRQSSQM